MAPFVPDLDLRPAQPRRRARSSGSHSASSSSRRASPRRDGSPASSTATTSPSCASSSPPPSPRWRASCSSDRPGSSTSTSSSSTRRGSVPADRRAARSWASASSSAATAPGRASAPRRSGRWTRCSSSRGGLLGVFGFAEIYPLIEHFNDSSVLGPLKVFDSLGISPGRFAFLLDRRGRRGLRRDDVDRAEAWTRRAPRPCAFPPPAPSSRAPASSRSGSFSSSLPDYKSRLLAKVSTARPTRRRTRVRMMTADELAFRIVDHEPRLGSST